MNPDKNLLQFLGQLFLCADMVTSPDRMVIPLAGSTNFDFKRALIGEHLNGVRRAGLIQSVGCEKTVFSILRFTGLKAIDDARHVASLLQSSLETIVTFNTQGDPKTSKGPTIPVYFERYSLIDENIYQVWIIHDHALPILDAWLTFQMMLLELNLTHCAIVLPKPIIPLRLALEDTIWLPHFGGGAATIGGQRLGATCNSVGVFLDPANSYNKPLDDLARIIKSANRKAIDTVFDMCSAQRVRALDMLKCIAESEMERSSSMLDDNARQSDLTLLLSSKHDALALPNKTLNGTNSDSRNAGISAREEVREWIENLYDIDAQWNAIGNQLRLATKESSRVRLSQLYSAISMELQIDMTLLSGLLVDAILNGSLFGFQLSTLLREIEALGQLSRKTTDVVVRWMLDNGACATKSHNGTELVYNGGSIVTSDTEGMKNLLESVLREARCFVCATIDPEFARTIVEKRATDLIPNA